MTNPNLHLILYLAVLYLRLTNLPINFFFSCKLKIYIFKKLKNYFIIQTMDEQHINELWKD